VAAVTAEPDFAFQPSVDVIPGIDFLGWGFDATYRDTFFALKPQLFRFSYNDNPRGSEITYRYPLDTKVYAVPDQVFVRTVGKTFTDSWVFTNDFTRRFSLDLNLGLNVDIKKSSTIDLNLTFALNLVDETKTSTRIVQTLAEMELWQLYLGTRILRPEIVTAMAALTGNHFSTDPLSFELFIATYGSHYVDSITLGGSVSQKTVIENDSTSNLLKIAIGLNLAFQDSTGGTKVNLDLNVGIQDLKTSVQTNTTSTATIYGGDAQFTDFVLKAGDPDAAKLLYESWKSTLYDNPVGVRYRLVEIWTLFNDTDARSQMCTAVATYALKIRSPSPADYCKSAPRLRAGNERNGLEFLPMGGGNGI